MNRFRLITQMFKEIKETPANEQLVDALSKSEQFKKAAVTVHDLKAKAWRALDEAAFPENYTADKLIEDKSKPKNPKK